MSRVHLIEGRHRAWALWAAWGELARCGGEVLFWRPEPVGPDSPWNHPGQSLGRRWPWDPVAWWRLRRWVAARQVEELWVWDGMEQLPWWARGLPCRKLFLCPHRSEQCRQVVRLARFQKKLPPVEVRLPPGVDAGLREELTRCFPTREFCPQAGWSLLRRQLVSPLGPLAAGLQQAQSAQPLVLAVPCEQDWEAVKLMAWAGDVLAQILPGVQVWFVGTCALQGPVRQFVRSLRCWRQIHWAPWPWVLSRLLLRADVLWWGETEDVLLLGPAEAARAGVPVLSWSRPLLQAASRIGCLVQETAPDSYELALCTRELLQPQVAKPASGNEPSSTSRKP